MNMALEAPRQDRKNNNVSKGARNISMAEAKRLGGEKVECLLNIIQEMADEIAVKRKLVAFI